MTIMASQRQKLPCPLGARCPTGQKEHYSDTAVYREHLAMAQKSGGGKGGNQKDKNNKQDPYSDFDGRGNTGDEEKRRKERIRERNRKDNQLDTFARRMMKNNPSVKSADMEDGVFSVEFTSGRKTRYVRQKDGTYLKQDSIQGKEFTTTDHVTEEEMWQDLRRINNDRGQQRVGRGQNRRRNTGPKEGFATNMFRRLFRRLKILPE